MSRTNSGTTSTSTSSLSLSSSSSSSSSAVLVPYAPSTDMVRHHAFLPRPDPDDDGPRIPVTEVLSFGGGGDLGVLLRGPSDVDVGVKPVQKLAQRCIVDISCSAYSSAALTESGEVYVGGINDEGQLLCDHPEQILSQPCLVEQLATQRVMQVAVGEHHVGVVNANQQALTFGSNEHSALGHSETRDQPYRVPPRVVRGLPGGTKVVQISCGVTHTLLLSRDGQVFSMGGGAKGALGHGNRLDMKEATCISTLSPVPICQVAAGDHFSLAVSASGAAYAWGSNRWGQLGITAVPCGTDLLSPDRITEMPELIQMAAAGESHSAWVSRSGRLYVAGRNGHGQLGLGWMTSTTTTTTTEQSGINVKEGESGSSSSSSSGAVSVETSDGNGARTIAFINTPTLVSASSLGDQRVREVACGARHTLVLCVNGRVYGMGDSREGATGIHLDKNGLVGGVGAPVREGAKVGGEASSSLSSSTTAIKPHSVTFGGSTPPAEKSAGNESSLAASGEGAEKDVAAFASNDNEDIGSALSPSPSPSPIPLDLQWARNGSLWGPTCIPSLSNRGVFRIASGGDHNLAIRVTHGYVVSTQPGCLPRGLMVAVDAHTLLLVAKNAAATNNPALLKTVIRDVLSHMSNVNGSFLSDSGAVVVEARAAVEEEEEEEETGDVSAAQARASIRAARRGAESEEGGKEDAEAAELREAIRLVEENDERRAGGAASAPASASSSSASSSASSSSRDDGDMSPAIVSQHPLLLPRSPVLASPRIVSRDAPAAAAVAAPAATEEEGAKGTRPTESTNASSAAAEASPASTADDSSASTGPSLPLLRIRAASERAQRKQQQEQKALLAPPPSSPRAVPRTPLGLASTSSVRLASMRVGPIQPSSLLLASSGLDVGGLELANRAMLQSHSTVFDLVHSGASLMDELDVAAPTLNHHEALRAFMVLWMSPVNLQPSLSLSTVARLCCSILALPQASRDRLFKWIGVDVPGALFAARFIQPLQAHLSYHISECLAGKFDKVVAKTWKDGGGAGAGAASSSGLAAAGANGSASSGSGPSASGRTTSSFPSDASTSTSGATGSRFSKSLPPITHLGALEAIVRVLRLCYLLNERLSNEAQAALENALQLQQRQGMDSAGASFAMDGESSMAGTSSSSSSSSSAGNWDLKAVPLGALVPASAFHNATVSKLDESSLLTDYSRWKAAGFQRRVDSFSLCSYPFLFDALGKRRLLGLEAQMGMQASAASSLFGGAMLGQPFTGFPLHPSSPYLNLVVRRSHLLSDTLTALASLPVAQMKKQLKIAFADEEGIDAGGVKKEFFQLLIREVFDEKYGMWVYNNETRTHYFNPGCPPDLEREFLLVGVLIGLAIYNGILLDLHFPPVLFKKLLGLPTGLYDLRGISPSLASGIEALARYTGDDVEDTFMLDWGGTYSAFGEAVVVPVDPTHHPQADEPVTSANKDEYVKSYVDWYMNGSVEASFREFKKGFTLALGGHVLSLCRPEELELLVVGTPHLDFKALQAVTTYEGGYGPEHATIITFWKIVHSLSDDLKMKLLLFSTGSAKAPIGGLGNLTFKIQRMGPDTLMLPTASTCFNTLLLPDYSSEEKMRTKLIAAISECAGFGLQ